MNSHPNQNEGFRIVEEFVCEAIPDPSVLAPMSLKVELDWPGVNPQEFVDELGRALPEECRDLVSLSVEPARRIPGTLALDAAIIGANIEGGVTVVATFISAWLAWPKLPKPKGALVVITVQGGATHELPIDASPEQLNQIVSAVKNAQKVQVKMKIRK